MENDICEYTQGKWKKLSIKYNESDNIDDISEIMKNVYEYLESNHVIRAINSDVRVIFSNNYTMLDKEL